MRKRGQVMPAFYFLTGKGLPGALYYDEGDFNEAHRDRFALTCKTVGIATAATASVFVCEMWMGMGFVPPGADPETFRPAVMPSADPDREEFVLLQGEAHGQGPTWRFLNIVRYNNGKFHNLTQATIPGFGSDDQMETAGRFARMLPEGEPPATARRFAQMFLKGQALNYQALYSMP